MSRSIVIECRSDTRTGRRPTKTEHFASRDDAPDSSGMLLRFVQVTPPVASVFTGIAYLRKLAGHRRRIRKEEERLRLEEKAITAVTRTGEYVNKNKPSLPGRRNWKSLRVVNCTECGRVLLGESEEHLRDIAIMNEGKRGKAFSYLKHLPPPIAGRRHDARPYCQKCLEREDG